VRRVASAFNNNGQGVRGDMKAVIRAVLLDEEARGDNARKQPSFGRIREPLLRFPHLMRAFEASSRTGYWNIGRTEVPGYLNQTAMRAPSVFNFYRPGYSPAGTPIAREKLVAPEMQILNESSVAGYADYLDRFVGGTSIYIVGLGEMIPHPEGELRGKAREIRFNLQPLIAKAKDEPIVNAVRTVYKPFTVDELNKKIIEMLRPEGMTTPVELVYQSVEGLHHAIPDHPGDWYFTGNYPTRGGMRLVNQAFIDYYERVHRHSERMK